MFNEEQGGSVSELAAQARGMGATPGPEASLGRVVAVTCKRAVLKRPSNPPVGPPRLSVVTPSKNQGRYLERTLQSVLNQGLNDVEYLAVDGGSADASVATLRRYGDRLQWISQPDNGHGDAVNKGIRRTVAPIIGWLNSDDVYYPGALETVLEYFDSHPETDVVYGDANLIDADDRVIGRYQTEPFSWERLTEFCIISQPAAFFRRSVCDRWGLLDVTLPYSIDYEYWLRLAKGGARFDYLPKLLAATRVHPDTFTISQRLGCYAGCNDALKRHVGRVPDSWLLHYAHAKVDTDGVRPDDWVRYRFAIALASLQASLRWNGAVSRNLAWNSLKLVASGFARSLGASGRRDRKAP